MLDEDLAELYNVTTGNLNKAVKRNIARFPDDFMFQLTKEEFDNLLFHIGRSSWGGRRTPPQVFTEQGVAMLSSVLRSKHAIEVNIFIMRAFVKMRSMYLINEELKLQSRKIDSYDEEIEIIIQTIEKMLTIEPGDTKKIGFE